MATEWKLRNTQAIILCCFCCCWFYVVWLKDAAGDAGWLKPYLLNKRRTNVNCGEYVNTNTTKSLSKLFAFNFVFFVFCFLRTLLAFCQQMNLTLHSPAKLRVYFVVLRVLCARTCNTIPVICTYVLNCLTRASKGCRTVLLLLQLVPLWVNV